MGKFLRAHLPSSESIRAFVSTALILYAEIKAAENHAQGNGDPIILAVHLYRSGKVDLLEI